MNISEKRKIILKEIIKEINSKRDLKEYYLLSNINIDSFFIDEEMIENNFNSNDLDSDKLSLLFSKDLESLAIVAKYNGENGLYRMNQLNREMRIRNNKTLLMGLNDFASYYNQRDSEQNELLIRLTSNKSVFAHVNYEDLVLLISRYNEIMLEAVKNYNNSNALKYVANTIRYATK